MTAELPSKSFKLIIKKRFAGEWGAEEGTSEVNIPCVRVADFDRARNVVSDDVPTIRSISKRTAKAKQLRNQDILIEKSGGGDKTPVGTPILYLGSENAICSNFIEVVRLRSGHDPRFWTYVLISSYESGNTRRFINQTTGIQNIDSQRFYDQVFQVPALETQQRIADYLDRETAEIDAAVADLDRYVELLEKRKRATGLAILEQARHEPTTLMVHLGSLGLFVSGSGFPHRYQGVEGEEFPFYKVGSLSTADEDGIIQDSRHSVSREVAEELGAKIIPTGSVLMAKIGEAMRLCRFVVTATDCCIDNNMMAIIPRQDNITSDYLRLAL